MTSKFFAVAGDSSSEDSEPEVQEKKEEVKAAPKRVNFFVDDDSDEEAPARVIKTQKDKRFDSLRATLKLIENRSKINDFTSIQTEFDTLLKELDKAKKVIEKEGFPNFLVRGLVELEDTILEVTNEMKKKFKQANAKAFNQLKARFVKEKERFAERMEAYREKPENSEEE